jgi:flagellar basal body-associated protein FliL
MNAQLKRVVIMDEQPAEQNNKPAKSYGKRSVWQWILIYLVIAIVVYAIIYFVFIHKSGTSSGTGNSGY